MKKGSTLTWFVLCFIIPLALAWLSLKMGWINLGNSNYGDWMEQEVRISNWQEQSKQRWGLLLLNPEGCQKVCLQGMQGLAASYTALGKKRQFVTAVVAGELAGAPIELQPFIGPIPPLEVGFVYLIDPTGMVLMRYPVTDSQTDNMDMFKGLIKDVTKLLSFERRDV